MADVNSPLEISDLDFDQIKTNLKKFLKTTTDFQDYDFEGSNLSVLIDLLAYNTFYNSYYLNMVGNEMFMDTAVLRESLISKSKELNYVPQSATSAAAVVNLLVEYDGSGIQPSLFTIPENTKFTASVDSKTYTFTTDKAYTAFQVGSTAHYTVDNVRLLEGEPLEFTYDAHDSSAPQKYVIPNDNVDITKIKVFVQKSASNLTKTNYTRAENLFDLTPTSEVFFLQAFTGSQYEIIFGDGVFGKKLETGNIVSIEYCATDGDEPNSASAFTFADSLPQIESITATTVSNAAGGSFEETNESIRFRAPRHYATQFRAVTAADYKSLIEQSHPTFRSVRVYGGEEATPPEYGKVFIAVRPGETDELAEIEKDQVISFLSDKKVVSVTPEVVNPDYIFLDFNYIVNYDPDKTPKSAGEIEADIRQEIITFGENNLGKFGASLRASKFASQIDNTNAAILGSTGTFNVAKRIKPLNNRPQSFKIQFNNAIRRFDAATERREGYNPSVFSTQFNVRFPANAQGESTPAFLQDDGTGILYVYTNSNLGRGQTILQSNAGTVDYATGEINIQSVWFVDYPLETGLEIRAFLQEFDVRPVGNQILLVDEAGLEVTAVPERTASV